MIWDRKFWVDLRTHPKINENRYGKEIAVSLPLWDYCLLFNSICALRMNMRFGFAYVHYIANYQYEGTEFPHDECFPTSIGRMYKNVFTPRVIIQWRKSFETANILLNKSLHKLGNHSSPLYHDLIIPCGRLFFMLCLSASSMDTIKSLNIYTSGIRGTRPQWAQKSWVLLFLFKLGIAYFFYFIIFFYASSEQRSSR